jgi:hypothetical protein
MQVVAERLGWSNFDRGWQGFETVAGVVHCSPQPQAERMSQHPMQMVKPPGLDIGHAGLGAARELFLTDLVEH